MGTAIAGTARCGRPHAAAGPLRMLQLLAVAACAAASVAHAASAGGPDSGGHGGGAVQLRSCSPSTHSAFQRWAVKPHPTNASEVTIRLAVDPTACMNTGSGGTTVWVKGCGTSSSPVTDNQSWVLRQVLHGDAAHAALDGDAFLLVHAATQMCGAVAGCCDGAPFMLVDCAKCNQTMLTGGSPPADCLVTHNASTGQLRTVSSQICLDGGTALPTKGCTAGDTTKSLPFCDATRSNHDRALDLAKRLTVQEMASGVLAMLMVPQSFPDGSAYNRNLRQSAGVARLGVPPILYNEALHGVMAGCLDEKDGGRCPTIWPIHILQSAAFNRSLWRSIAAQVGAEGRALYNAKLDAANYFGPDVNPYRDPRYGRGQETPGEDAWVNAQVATEYILGLQDGPAVGKTERLQATAACKHILIYDGQSGTSVNATMRDLMDYYMVRRH